MTTAVSRRTIRRRLFDEIPVLGFAGTADSVAAGNIVDTFAFQDSNLTVGHFKGCYIYRPDRTDDDRVKKAGNLTLASGTLAHTGTNYGNTTDMVYEVVGVLHPDELNECIKRAQRHVYFETQVPLTLVTDGDMSGSDTTSWTSSNATPSKITTAANVFSGQRSMRVLNSAGDGYAQSATIRVSSTHPENVYMSAVCRADVGTANLILWDVTNSVALATISTTEEHWTHLWWQGSVGTTTEEIAIRLQGTGASDDVYWDYAIFYRLNDMRVGAPSWLDEPFKFLKLRQAAFRQSLGTNVDTASSRFFRDWYTPREFSLDPFHLEANPYAIQFTRPISIADMWIEGKRPLSDVEPLTNDTDTTLGPYDQVVAHAKLELANLLIKRFPGEPRWLELKVEAERETTQQLLARPEIPQMPIRRNQGGRI